MEPHEKDSAERRLNELGYKQELHRSMSMAKALGIAFSTVTLFTGIIPLYGFSLSFEGPPPLVWGWLIVSFFTWFVALALAEICSSFPTAGSLYFWTAHLAGPRWGPFASWCCAWLELLGTIASIGAQVHIFCIDWKKERDFALTMLVLTWQAYAGSQVLQNIVLLSTGTHKGGGYFAPPWVCLCIYICMAVIWGFLNTFTLELVAYIGIVSIWWQVIGGMLFVLYLPFVASRKQSASFVFLNFVELSNISRVPSKGYGVIMSLLISQYSLFGYDAAAHLTEETKDADLNGPIAILYSLAMVSLLGWAIILVLTFCIQDPFSLYDLNNETGGSFVPAQILYDIFYGKIP
ncbi:hypothetical protein L7F22_052545 [Adiantum nelumboides]|nr:hypothetical protein [Adiantum nelumboides]